MRLVIIESPYAGDVNENLIYGRRALLDSLRRGEAPLASHLLYPQVLDDNEIGQRDLGIAAGLEWYKVAEACVVYSDRGISNGMRMGIAMATHYQIPVEYRSLADASI